jgi:hypothetical protein
MFELEQTVSGTTETFDDARRVGTLAPLRPSATGTPKPARCSSKPSITTPAKLNCYNKRGDPPMANRKIYRDEFIHQLLYEKAQGATLKELSSKYNLTDSQLSYCVYVRGHDLQVPAHVLL